MDKALYVAMTGARASLQAQGTVSHNLANVDTKGFKAALAGTEAFNDELGRMTLLSYPMIAIPSMIMLMAIFYYLWKTIHGLTGLSLEEIMANSGQESQS